MGPAKAMGTFLRVWRSEWAKVSRAQLAIAVSAHLTKRKAVTPRAVLYWEEGHPPNSTEEFDGLCQVMRRNGLTHPEVQDFRKAVFAACLDRQYPELFPDEDFAQRDDVDEVARQICVAPPWMEPGGGTVMVVAAVTSLRESLMRGDEKGHAAIRRRQYAALAFLQHVLADFHGGGGRFALAGQTLGIVVDLLTEQFRGGLGHPLTAEWNRLSQLNTLAYEQLMRGGLLATWANPEMLGRYRRVSGGPPLTAWAGPEMLGRYRERVSGSPPVAARERDQWLTMICNQFSMFGGLEGWSVVHGLEEEHFSAADECGDRSWAAWVHAGAAMKDRRWADAERHAAEFSHWRDAGIDERYRWHRFTAHSAMARGDYAEALEHLPRAQALAFQAGDHGAEAWLVESEQQCEDALRSARLRRGSSANAKSGTKKTKRKPKPRKPKQ